MKKERLMAVVVGAWLTFATVAVLMILNGCKKNDATADKGNPSVSEAEKHCISDTLMAKIQLDSARVEKITDELNLSGEVSFNADRVVRVMPLTSGQVVEVKVSLGDFVAKGQTLAVMRSAEVAGTFNDVAATNADLATAERNVQNAESLFKSGLGSERDLIQAKNELSKAKSNVSRARDQQSVYGSDNLQSNGTITLKSPMSGYVVEKNIASGMQIRTDNATSLFTISDLQEVWVLANIFEQDISRVRQGFEADVTTLAYPNKVFKGKIDKIGNVLDPNNKVLQARIRLQNVGNLLKPEMFTTVKVLNTEGASSVAIPSAAVLMDGGKYFVVVFSDRCKYAVREVQILKNIENKTYVRDGLQAGEKVITKSQLLLFNELRGG